MSTANSDELALQRTPEPRARPVGSADAITRRIRNPLLAPAPTTSARPTPTPTPVLAPPLDEEATPEAVVELDVSKNIHVFPIADSPLGAPLPGPTSSPPPKRHGVIVVTTVVLAGAAIDIFLWKTCGARPATVTGATPALIEPAPAALAPEGAGASTHALSVASAPAYSHLEITVQAAQATLMVDGRALAGNPVKLDVPSDHQPHLLEVTAPGFARLSRSLSFARDLDLVIELQRAPPPAPAGATVAPPQPARPARPAARSSQPTRARTPARRSADTASDPWATSSRRPSSAIDETDPFAP